MSKQSKQPRIEDTVTKAEDGTFMFTCPSPKGCGAAPFDPASRFTSDNWPTKEIAMARGLQHINEHLTGEPAQDLHSFRVDHGLVEAVDDDAQVDLSLYLPDSTPEG